MEVRVDKIRLRTGTLKQKSSSLNIFIKGIDWNRNVVGYSHFLHIRKEFVVTAVLCNQVHNWLVLLTVATPRVVYGRQSHLLLVC